MAGLPSVKVALLSDCFLPRLGGIEVQVHDLADQLNRAGHDAEVFTATPGDGGDRAGGVEVVDGIRVHRMALSLPFDIPVNPLAPPEVRRRLQAGGFDVAHVHMGVVSPFATDMVRVALGLRLPTAVTWHCVIERSAPLFRTIGHIRRWTASGAALSAVSGMAAARVSTVAGGGVVEVLPNGIDAARWARADGGMPGARLDDEGHPVRIVSALRLARRKRPQALLGMLHRVRQLVPARVRLEAILVGEGPQRRLLERYLERHGMAGWAHLPGRVSRDELRELYWQSDLYVSAARLEAFGIAALEARAAGLPVIARAGTGVEDFVQEGVNGLVAATDDEMAVATAELVTDDRLRARLATHNRRTAPAQDWPAVLDLVLAEYARAQRLRERRGGAR
jgi:glycogen(starch) synthase